MNADAVAEKNVLLLHHNLVYGWLIKRSGNPQLAGDLAQDTFIVAIRKLRAGEIRRPESMAAFLKQTASNLLVAHYRKERFVLSGSGDAPDLPDPQVNWPALDIDRRRMQKVLDEAITQLNVRRDREILRRHYLMDHDKVRICGDLDLNASQFDRVLHRARQRLRKLLTGQFGLADRLPSCYREEGFHQVSQGCGFAYA